MADLAKNSLWADIENKAGSVSTDIMGPAYSYSDNIPGPTSLGVGSGGSFGQLFTNLEAAAEYVKIMITGDPALGNAYYVNTGGTCVAPDGSTQSRHNYINNVPIGKTLIPQSMNELSFLTNDLNGLIPGVAGDIESLDPMYLFNALKEEGNPSCQCYQCAVTTGTPYRFLTPDLSPDFDSATCVPVDTSLCTAAAKESFTNMGSVSPIPTLIAVGLLALLTFSGK